MVATGSMKSDNIGTDCPWTQLWLRKLATHTAYFAENQKGIRWKKATKSPQLKKVSVLYLESDYLLNVHVYFKRCKVAQWYYVLQAVLKKIFILHKNHMHLNPYAMKYGVSKSIPNHSPSKPMFFRFR